MSDWADEIAKALAPDDEFTWPEDEIAKALRKAKADGMREAAIIAEGYVDPEWPGDDLSRQAKAICDDCVSMADEIEKGGD